MYLKIDVHNKTLDSEWAFDGSYVYVVFLILLWENENRINVIRIGNNVN